MRCPPCDKLVIHGDANRPSRHAVHGLHPLTLFRWALFAVLRLTLSIYVIRSPFSRRVFGKDAWEGLLAPLAILFPPRLTRGRVRFWRGRHPVAPAARAKREGPPKRALGTMRESEENYFYGSSCWPARTA